MRLPLPSFFPSSLRFWEPEDFDDLDEEFEDEGEFGSAAFFIALSIFVSVLLPLLGALVVDDPALREALELYLGIGAAATAVAMFRFPTWHYWRGTMTITTSAVTFLGMFLAASGAAILAGNASQGYIAVPVTFSSQVRVMTASFKWVVFAFVVGWVEEYAENTAFLMLGRVFSRVFGLFLGMLISAFLVAMGFALIHVPAYTGYSPLDSAWTSSPNAWLLVAPFIARLIICIFVTWERSFIGATLGHGAYDAFVLAFVAIRA